VIISPFDFIPEPECAVVVLLALLIFAALSAATWSVSMACYKSTYSAGPHPSADPNYSTVAACAVAAVTLSCFLPFAPGYIAELVIWTVTVYGFLNLSTGRATILMGYLAAASVVARLVTLSVLSVL
jgi:hypothetical protein